MTTIVAVKKNNKLVMIGDGQVTQGSSMVMKNTAKKLRVFEDSKYDSKVLIGLAGSVTDAIILIDDLIGFLKNTSTLEKAAVDFVSSWKKDKFKRTLEASLLVGNKDKLLVLDGSGTVIEPDENFSSIGSGSPYALGSLYSNYDIIKDTNEIAERAIKSATRFCCFTNGNYRVEESI